MTHFINTWGYLALVIITLLASMGLPTGSELAIVFAGALASGKIAHAPDFDLVVVIILATVSELVGSYVGYGIGRIGGRPLLARFARVTRVTDRDLDRTERLFHRYGAFFVVFGRFIPLVRSFVGIAAGLGRMAVLPYTLFTAISVAIWCSGFAILGDVLGGQWRHVSSASAPVAYSVLGILVIGGLTVLTLWLRRGRAARVALAQDETVLVGQAARRS